MAKRHTIRYVETRTPKRSFWKGTRIGTYVQRRYY